jgi:hypothetical protein
MEILSEKKPCKTPTELGLGRWEARCLLDVSPILVARHLSTVSMDATKTCAFRAEQIPAIAVRCPFCRSDLPSAQTPIPALPLATAVPPASAAAWPIQDAALKCRYCGAMSLFERLRFG